MKLQHKMRFTERSSQNAHHNSYYHMAVPIRSSVTFEKVGFLPGTYVRCYLRNRLPKNVVWVLRDKANLFNTFCYIWIAHTLADARKLKADHDSDPDHKAELTHPVPYVLMS